MDLKSVKGDVEFEDVRFSYGNGRAVIDGVTLNVKAGQKVAIVGRSGCGKTTLMNILMGFYEYDGGAIRIDGIPITEMTHAQIHGMFSLV